MLGRPLTPTLSPRRGIKSGRIFEVKRHFAEVSGEGLRAAAIGEPGELCHGLSGRGDGYNGGRIKGAAPVRAAGTDEIRVGWLADTAKGRPRARTGPEPNGYRPSERPMTADLSALDIERRLTAIEATLPTFATKADIHSLRTDIQAMRTEWKSDLGEMKADLHAREARLIKWIAGLVVAGAAAAAGVAIAVNQILAAGVGG